MDKTAFAALILTLACGSSFSVSDTASVDGGVDTGRPFDAAAHDGGLDDPDADVPFPETGCGGDRWCWVMGAPIHDIHGVDPSAVFAVGAEGMIRMHDGTSWTDHSSPTRGPIDSVVARSADAVWILTEGNVWHYDGDVWTLELGDDPTEWPTDMLVLDSEGTLHTARRQYSGSEYWTILRTYVGGWWIVGEYRSVVEASPEESYNALRPSLVAYEHAFDPAYWGEAPAEVWVKGARAAWGTHPNDVVRARVEDGVWERSPGFEELTLPLSDPWFYRSPQERDAAVAGFPDGSAIILQQRQMFRLTDTSVRAWAGPEQPTLRALSDGRVLLAFIDELDGVAVGRIRVQTSATDAIDYAIHFDECTADPLFGDYRGVARLVDVDAHDDEIWVSVMMDQSRTGTPCLFHYDGESWAARGLGLEDRFVLQSFGYMITVDDEGALLAGAGSGGAIEVVEVPRAFMRSGEPASSLVRTPVPETVGFRNWMSPRIWRGPTGVWLYDNHQALFRQDY